MKKSLIILLGMILLFYSIHSIHAPDTLIDSYDGTVNVDSYLDGQHPSASSLISSLGQTFTPAASYSLTSARMIIRRTSVSSTGTWKAYLYAHQGTFGTDGIPTGSALAESTTSINWDDLPSGSWAFSEFEFDGSFTLQPNTPYCLVVYSLDGVFDASRYCRIGSSTLKGHGGNCVYYSSSAWSYSTSRDVFFYVYGEAITAQSTISDYLGIAAALMVSLFFLVFITHFIYLLQTGKTQNLVSVLAGYLVAAIILAALGTIMLSIGG